jgi:hypothetical protein
MDGSPIPLHQQLLQVECDLKCAAKWRIWPFAFSNVPDERGLLSVLVVSTRDRNMHKGSILPKYAGQQLSLIADTPVLMEIKAHLI